MTNKDSNAILNIDALSKAQLAFLEFCKEIGWGKFEVEVRNGEPVMGHIPIGFCFIRRLNMPKEFNACVNEGGRVRTMTLKGGRYMKVCFDKAGKSHAGEVHQKQSKSKKT